MTKKRAKRKFPAPIVTINSMPEINPGGHSIGWVHVLALVVLIGGGATAARWYSRPSPAPIVMDNKSITFRGDITMTSDRVCLVLSGKAPDSDMSELDVIFKSLQRRGAMLSVKRAEWDDAGDRLRGYFNVVECGP